MSTHPPRIFVTGMGAVTPLGFSVPATWRALLAGASAISPLDLFDPGGLPCTQAGQIHSFTPPALVPLADPRDRATGFAAAACVEALRQSSLLSAPGSLPTGPGSLLPALPTGLVTATNFGSIGAGESALTGAATPQTSRALLAGNTTDILAAAFQLNGPRATLTLSCAAGAAALAYAAGLIRHRRADRMLVVGFDSLSRFAWSGLCALRTMTRDRVRPFDLNRSGTLFSEGAASLLLESEASCRARGARPLAELSGWGTGNNGFHMTAPAPRGAGSAQVMRMALACAGLAPEAIDHFNAHGTGTLANDLTEAQALADVFGPAAARIPVTSIKASIGHMLGAAGVIEAIASIQSLRESVIPPTLHVETPDPACAIDLVANHPRPAHLRHVLSNSAGIGGCNAAVILSRTP